MKEKTKTEIENKIDNESPLKSQRRSALHSRRASCFSSQPWPSLVQRVHGSESPPANSLGQDPSLIAALGNTSLKPLDFRISQGMCLLEVVAPKRLFEIVLPCATCKGVIMVTVSDQIMAYAFLSSRTPGTKSFAPKGWLRLWWSSMQGGHSGTG